MSTRITLKPQTAARVKQLVERGPHFSRQPASGALARGVTWVKVTGSPDGDGWHPAVPSLDTDGAWVDLTTAVLVAAADYSELVTGGRYLCTRTGDDEDNVARFRTVGGTGTITIEGPGGTPSYPGTGTITLSPYFTYSNPSPGTVLVQGPTGGSDRVTFFGMRDGQITLELTHTAADGTQTTETSQIPGCRPQECCDAATGGAMTVVMEGTPSAGPVGQEVSFTGGIVNGVAPYVIDIDWDDGTAHGTSLSETHTFTAPGMYEVMTSVTDACGRTASWTEYVMIYSDPCLCGDGSIRWPLKFEFQLTGGDGAFADANGNWSDPNEAVYLWQDADGNCFWNGDRDTGIGRWKVKFEYVGTYALRATFTDETGNQIVYHSGSALTPCGPFTGWVEDSHVGTGTRPTFVSDTVTTDAKCGRSCVTILTACSTTRIPSDLDAVVTGGSCAGPYVLSYGGGGCGGGDVWGSEICTGGAPPAICLSCAGGTWVLTDSTSTTYTLTSFTTSPLQWVFSGSGGSLGITSVTITG